MFWTYRHLLTFGDVSDYLGYSAMTDYFPRMTLKPNPDCDEYHCKNKQQTFAKAEKERKKNEESKVLWLTNMTLRECWSLNNPGNRVGIVFTFLNQLIILEGPCNWRFCKRWNLAWRE